jgi:drug/metabolite transporter (DMT)-like permease
MTDARNTRALPVLLALGCTWGASFLFIKVIVEDTGPFELVTGRLFFGALTVAVFMRVRRIPVTVQPALIARIAVLALVSNVIPFALIAWGEKHIDSGLASVLNSTVPIFTAIFAAAVLAEERVTAARLLGLLLAFIGVMVLTGDGVLRITDSDVLGQLAVIGAAACYGMGAVYSRTLLRAYDPVTISIWQLMLGTLFATTAIFIFEGTPDVKLGLDAIGSVIALGIFGTGIGYIAWLWLIETTGSVRASLVTYIVPVMGLFLGWIVLGEDIGPSIILGALCIVAGVAVVIRGQAPASERMATLAQASPDIGRH